MVWALDLDDFTGDFCGEGKWPLMTAIKTSLSGGKVYQFYGSTYRPDYCVQQKLLDH